MNETTKTTTENAPKIGDPATVCIGTDQYGATVEDVRRNGREVEVSWDIATPGPGHDYHGGQRWEHTRDPNGRRATFTLRKNGAWKLRGESMVGSYSLLLGMKHTYQDPHF